MELFSIYDNRRISDVADAEQEVLLFGCNGVEHATLFIKAEYKNRKLDHVIHHMATVTGPCTGLCCNNKGMAGIFKVN